MRRHFIVHCARWSVGGMGRGFLGIKVRNKYICTANTMRKQPPYTCISCGHTTEYRNDMRRHFYKRKKQCPMTLTHVVLTDEIKEYILANRVYRHYRPTTSSNDGASVGAESSTAAADDDEGAVDKQRANRKIPQSVRYALWNREFGERNGAGHCRCCQRLITQQTFHAGHIIAKALGGNDDLTNLVPLCASCNTSMGVTNFHEFSSRHFKQ